MRSLILLAVIQGVLAAQGLTLELRAGPSSFNTPGQVGTSPGGLTSLVATEVINLRMSQTPTIPFPPPLFLPVRRVQLWAGIEVANPFPAPIFLPNNFVFLNFSGGPLSPFTVVNSLTGAGPTFGPGLVGQANEISLTLPLVTFPPFVAPNLLFQAIAEDTNSATTGIYQISNPARLQMIDPQLTRPPTLQGISPAFGGASGGNIVVLTGSNFLAQSNWSQFPPIVRFGGVPSTQVVILDQTTILCVVPPAPVPTNPPFASCTVGVTLQNHPQLSPLAAPTSPPIPYLFTTGLTPQGVAFQVDPVDPEGGGANALLGSGFLNGIVLEFQSVSNPALTTSLTVPALPSGTTVPFATPTFCSGDVQVTATNCDGGMAISTELLSYAVINPVIAALSPTTTLPAELTGATIPFVTAAGSNLTIGGDGFLSSSSPLAAAPTVPAGTFFPTRIFLDGSLEAGLSAVSRSSINGGTLPRAATGLTRSQLGLKNLFVQNPPCVGGPPYSSPVPSPTSTVLIRDVNPPTLLQSFPTAIAGTGEVVLSGSNFFSLDGSVTQDFEALAGSPVIGVITPSLLRIPAVRFQFPTLPDPPRFARRVTLESGGVLRIVPPPSPNPLAVVPVLITVFNPDFQASAVVDAELVPNAAPPGAGVLDESTVNQWYLNGGSEPTLLSGSQINPNALLGSPSVLIVRNPSPDRDRLRDPWAQDFGTSCYDYCLLFNTLGSTGQNPRLHAFDLVNLPPVITLPAGGRAFVLDLHPFPQLPPCVQDIPPGTTVRVIIKALGYRFVAGGSLPQFSFPDDALTGPNWPLMISSATRLDTAAFFGLGGDSLVVDEPTAQAGCFPTTAPCPAPPRDGYRFNTEATLPPAGAGAGGRGGRSYGTDGLTAANLPFISLVALFSSPPALLRGQPGRVPSPRPAPSPAADTVGKERTGTGFIGVDVRAGSGGGAGFAGQGAGASLQVPGPFPGLPGSGGAPIGNATNFAGLPGAPAPVPPLTGTIADDLIYGQSLADFGSALFLAQGGQLLYGGSGGGGGGMASDGILKLRLGGRGGNGGGSLVLSANSYLSLLTGCVLFAPGGTGRRGYDASLPGATPPLGTTNTLGGAGGGGSGGTVFLLSPAEVLVNWNPSPTASFLLPPSASNPSSVILDVRGGGSQTPALNGGAGAGGSGASGRWRAVTNRGPAPAGIGLQRTTCTFLGGLIPGCTSTTMVGGQVLPIPMSLAPTMLPQGTGLLFFGYP